MNKFFEEHFHEASSEQFSMWFPRYSAYLETLMSTERHWQSEGVWKMIQQKAVEEWWWTEEERQWWTWEIKRKTKANKKRWLMDQMKEDMDEKEKWNGSKALRKEYKQNVYVIEDKAGNEIMLGDKAVAMAEYLEEVQWGAEGVNSGSIGEQEVTKEGQQHSAESHGTSGTTSGQMPPDSSNKLRGGQTI